MTTSIFDNAFRHVDPVIREQYAVTDEDCCFLVTRSHYKENNVPGPRTALKRLTRKSKRVQEWQELQAKKKRLFEHHNRIRAQRANWKCEGGDTSDMAEELATLFIAKGVCS